MEKINVKEIRIFKLTPEELEEKRLHKLKVASEHSEVISSAIENIENILF